MSIVGVVPSQEFFWPLVTGFYIRFRLKDAGTKELIAGATVTAQMYDFEGDTFGSSISGSAVSGLSGYYELTVPSSLALIENNHYQLRITIVSTETTTVVLEGRAKWASLLNRLDTVISIVS